MANKGRSVKVGAVTYPSFKKYLSAAVKMAEKKGEKAPSYMTLYMRVRQGKTPASAMATKVRTYHRKSETELQEEVS